MTPANRAASGPLLPRAQMAELVDAPASGAGARKGVEVRVLFWAPFFRVRASHQDRRAGGNLPFFDASSFRTALSRIAAASSFVGREFSFSRDRSRRASDAFRPPNFDFHFSKVAELIPWRRQASAVAIPAFCCFKIATICSALNLFWFRWPDSFASVSAKKRSHFSGARHKRILIEIDKVCGSWRRNGVAVPADFRALLPLRSPVSKRWRGIDPDRYFFESSQSFDLYSQKCVI